MATRVRLLDLDVEDEVQFMMGNLVPSTPDDLETAEARSCAGGGRRG